MRTYNELIQMTGFTNKPFLPLAKNNFELHHCNPRLNLEVGFFPSHLRRVNEDGSYEKGNHTSFRGIDRSRSCNSASPPRTALRMAW